MTPARLPATLLRGRGARHVELQCESGLAAEAAARLAAWVRRLYPDAPPVDAVETLRPVPYARYAVGGDADRPGVHGPWANLFFAGDWVTEPGGTWFMERAVATGRAAAAAAQDDASVTARAPLEGPAMHALRIVLRAARWRRAIRARSASVAGRA